MHPRALPAPVRLCPAVWPAAADAPGPPAARCLRLLALAVIVVLGLAPDTALSQDREPSTRFDCQQWPVCRQLALDAAARGEYETAHDLAWRAVQVGPTNDPDLMYLLARAQCLSGRPHDALVMLQRLADKGVWTDAATNDDFRRARALQGWDAVKASIERVGSAGAAARRIELPPSVPAPTPSTPTPAAPPTPDPTPAPAGAPPAAPERPDRALAVMAVAEAPIEEAARFSTEPFAPGGLAYDSVSRRFVFGDAYARRLKIVAEGMHHTVNLVSAPSAGFHDVVALEIDTRRGDLWVASATASGDAAALHKLQLVSGRPLATVEAPAALEPLMPVDVAVTAAGTVFVLDRAGQRVLGLAPDGDTLEVLAPVDVEAPASLAPFAQHVAYVAHRDGIARLDLTTRSSRPLAAPAGLWLGGFERIRRYRDSLVGVQARADGTRQVVRLALGPGGRVVTAALAITASIAAGDGPTCATIAGDDLYYLVVEPYTGSAGPDTLAEVVVARVSLRGK